VGTVRRRTQDVQEVEEVHCYEETAPQYAGTWTDTEWTYLHTEYPQHICRTPDCKNESGPTVTATYGTGSAECALENALKGKKSTNEATTELVLLFFRPNTLCN
jgi:hypothetical protein